MSSAVSWPKSKSARSASLLSACLIRTSIPTMYIYMWLKTHQMSMTFGQYCHLLRAMSCLALQLVCNEAPYSQIYQRSPNQSQPFGAQTSNTLGVIEKAFLKRNFAGPLWTDSANMLGYLSRQEFPCGVSSQLLRLLSVLSDLHLVSLLRSKPR